MAEPTFDVDGYPTEETLERLRTWPITDAAAALDFVAAAWHWPNGVSRELRLQEAELLFWKPSDRFLRFATGGWSGNESLIDALKQSQVAALTWRLSSAGGLHIFQYPG